MPKLQKQSILAPLFFALSILVYSKDFVDVTTYPKLVSMTLVISCLAIYFLRDSKSITFLLALILIWSGVLLLSVIQFGLDKLSSLLFGYPQRNLGLLSLLIFILSIWIFYEKGFDFFLLFLKLVGAVISMLVIFSHLPGDLFIFDQFVYPNPDALNSNVISPILAFSLLSWFPMRFQVKESNSLITLVVRGHALLFTFIAMFLLGNFQSWVYLLMIMFCFLLLKIRTPISRFIFRIMPILLSSGYVFTLYFFRNQLERFGDSSIRERLLIIDLVWSEIVSRPVRFRAIDTTADLDLKYSLIIDNSHNVWLEIGVHAGLLGMILTLIASLGLLLQSTLLLRGPQHSRVSFGETHLLLVFQQLAFLTLFFVILHPISIWIYGAIIGVSLHFLFPDGPLVGLKKMKLPLPSLLMKANFGFSFVAIALVVTSAYVTVDAVEKYQFRQFEKALVSNEVNFEVGLEQLFKIAIQLNDRGYLNYAGQRFIEIERCREVKMILKKQQLLGFMDLNTRNLESTWRLVCTGSAGSVSNP